MKRQKKLKGLKKLLGSMAMTFAMVLSVNSIGSLQVSAAETTENETTENGTTDSGMPDSETVSITIDNSVSHLAVRFYPDTNDMDYFEGIDVGATATYTVPKDSVARIRLYVQADGYCVPENYVIEGASKLMDDDRVNWGWCRAAYTITADTEKTITIPEASVCTHPYADPSVRWGYYDCGNGKHAQACTLCALDIPSTIANHTLSEMTATEYVDWYYNDSNFAGMSEEVIASRKAEFISHITNELGIDANTKMKACTVCEHFEKIEDTSTETPGETPDETPTVPETPSSTESTSSIQAPTATSVAASLNDTNGVLSPGITIASVRVMSGDTYEKASTAVRGNISGAGQFAVMEINLTDALNVQIHELNGYVQVSIPVPSNISVGNGKMIAVYRLEDNGTLTHCQTTVENGMITFSTNHFSTYIVVEEDMPTAPKTGEDSHMLLYMMILFMSGIGLIIASKKRLRKLFF